MAAKTGNPIVDLVTATLEKQFEIVTDGMPYHLFELEQAARQQCTLSLGGSGWTDETIEKFILKWCRKYNGQYASEDVAMALRYYNVDPNWLDDVAKTVSEKYGGSPIYTSETDPRDRELYESLERERDDDEPPF